MSIQVLPDRFGINQALQGLGPVLGQALSNRFANQQKRSTAQNVAGLLNRPITSEQDATEFLQGAIGAGLDPREAFGLLDSMLKSRQAFQSDPVAELLGFGGESASQPSMGGDQFQRPPGISGSQRQDVTTPRSRLESLTDGELVTLQSSPNARMRALGKAEQERRALQSKETRADRDFSYKRAEPQFKKIEKIRGTLPERESALNEIQGALESGALDGWNQNYLANFFGRLGEGFITPEGAIFQSSVKEYLLNNIGRVGGRPNQWIEQQISGALPNLGKSAEANRAIASMLLAASRRDKAEVAIFDRIVGEYEDAGRPIPLGLDRLVSKELESFERGNQKQLALDLAEIKESKLSDEDLRKDLLKKVPRGTPITERRARLLDEKYGAKSKAVARKLGYDVDAPSSDDNAAPKQDVNPEPASEKTASVTPLSDEVKDDELDQSIAIANAPQGPSSSGLLSNILELAIGKGGVPAAKGLVEGIAQLFGGGSIGAGFPGMAAEGTLTGLEELPGGGVRGIYQGAREDLGQQLDRVIPQDENAFQRGIRRGARMIPGVVGAPASIAGVPFGQSLSATTPRALLAGGLGQTVEEFGGGPLAQAAAEVAGFSLPGLKGLTPTKAQKNTYSTLKSLGMTDEQIAPILSAERYAKGNKITSGLASFAKKSSKTSEKLAQSRLGLGDAFDTLSKKALNVGAGNDIAKATLIENINSTLGKLPANVGNVIRNDLSVLANSERTASDAITFWRAINHEAVGRNKGLSKLKGPVGDYLAKLDGNLYSEFKLTNDLYGKFAKFQKALLPPKDPGLLESGKPLAYIYGITTGNLPLLGELIGFSKTKQLATSMLTNPRYQNLSGQMISAIKSNSPAALRQVVNGFTKQLTKDGQIELVRQLNLLSDDDLLEILQAD